MLDLSIEAGLPLVYVRTDDIINVEEVLSFIAGEPVKPVNIPTIIQKISDLSFPEGRVFFTSQDCQSLVKLYHYCVENEKTVVFINSEKSVLQFDGGTLFPPKDLVLQFLSEMTESEDSAKELLPAYGGLTLKDIGEVSKLTMTRDAALTVRGIAETRRGYATLQGITQVDTTIPYYVCPTQLGAWLTNNKEFFDNPEHPSLIPRGLLFPGPPGTGKTLASMYIASVLNVPLYRLDLGAMMGKYVGQSEESLNSALAQVDQVEPCIPSTVVLNSSIGNLTIGELYERQGDGDIFVKGVNPDTLGEIMMPLYKVIKREDKRKIMTIITSTGSIRCTENHKLLCTREGLNVWVEAQNLTANDFLVEV